MEFLTQDRILLALNVIAGLAACYIAVRAFQQSKIWGLIFVLTPVAFYFLIDIIGALLAGVAVILVQMFYVTKEDNRPRVGTAWVVMVLSWLTVTMMTGTKRGFVPDGLLTGGIARQAGRPRPTAVEAHLPVPGGRIWYRRSGVADGVPVILVHGGPGAASFYLKPLEALGEDRPVVRYDQLGAGHADRVTDKRLFTIARFVAELDSLRSSLGFEEAHLIGHSWGSIVAFEYYRKHPQRVASLTLASAALSSPEWARNARRLLRTLSDSSQRMVRAAEAIGDFDSPDFQSATSEFSARYVTMRPVQADWDSTMKTFGRPLYSHMWGPSEFTVTGTLKTYDVTRQLRTIKVPTLYTVGEFDEADPATIKRFAALTPGSQYVVIPGAAHITTWDNADETVRVQREFLRAVDSTRAAKVVP
jgi:proline iminopeptidase